MEPGNWLYFIELYVSFLLVLIFLFSYDKFFFVSFFAFLRIQVFFEFSGVLFFDTFGKFTFLRIYDQLFIAMNQLWSSLASE